MTRFELNQLVCTTLDVISYRIGLHYYGKNHVSDQIEDMLDCYGDNHVLSEREVAVVNEWLSTYKRQQEQNSVNTIKNILAAWNRQACYIALKREIMVNPLETIPPRFQSDRIDGDREGKKARVVNRNESYVPPLCVGVCG